MIKNGHHHPQVNTAAAKDAGSSPGAAAASAAAAAAAAAACSPEKRRRRIRVWCDGWWVSDADAVEILFLLAVVWMHVSPAAPTGLACCTTAAPLHPPHRDRSCTELLTGYSAGSGLLRHLSAAGRELLGVLYFFLTEVLEHLSVSLSTSVEREALLHNNIRTDLDWSLQIVITHCLPTLEWTTQ